MRTGIPSQSRKLQSPGDIDIRLRSTAVVMFTIPESCLQSSEDDLTRIRTKRFIWNYSSLRNEICVFVRGVATPILYGAVCDFEAMVAAEFIEPMLGGEIADVPCARCTMV